MKPLIYLDNNSTTQVDVRVLESMLPYFSEKYANANSQHLFGIKVNEAVKVAREQVSKLIGAEPSEIIFTSGATESINTAIKGIAENYSSKGKHIVTVATEHHAVLDTCKYLESLGFDITYLSVQRNGLIDLKELKSVLRDDTILVSVMYVNNETGVIQPIKEIAELTHNANSLFLSDCTQAVGKIPIDVEELGIDLMCFSGHKMYAPKGVGALYLNRTGRKISLPALLHGGGHESGLRSGTLNVPGIVAFGKACSLALDLMKIDTERIGDLRNTLEEGMLKLPNTILNGSTKHRIYNVINICFSGRDANTMIGWMKNVAVSNGSACSSATIEPSHVLKSMGLSDAEAFASIRFSLGRFNDDADIQTVIEIFHNYYSQFPIEYA